MKVKVIKLIEPLTEQDYIMGINCRHKWDF